ncbi:claudin-34-like [Syngnathoides biaculeatus]|uniref:claudin-34-like n=1 Tax=Syngnathoides biaculeatus TaxID=300417 RepID=UPI002ADE898B|nr:claudin-34-like [Syngnathoides biaculeatus]
MICFHSQLCALWLGCVGWILTCVALGLVQWRVWLVYDSKVISSGVAWVGVWRACFNSHTLVSPGLMVRHCESISLSDSSTPPEIVAAQILMLLSLLAGLVGNGGGFYTLRNVYFGLEKNITRCCLITGALFLSASGMSLVPLAWNLNSVMANQTITFPPGFKMPRAPDSQHVGCGISVGMVGMLLMVLSGFMFCRFGLCLPVKLPVRSQCDMSVEKDNPVFNSNELCYETNEH